MFREKYRWTNDFHMLNNIKSNLFFVIKVLTERALYIAMLRLQMVSAYQFRDQLVAVHAICRLMSADKVLVNLLRRDNITAVGIFDLPMTDFLMVPQTLNGICLPASIALLVFGMRLVYIDIYLVLRVRLFTLWTTREHLADSIRTTTLSYRRGLQSRWSSRCLIKWRWFWT